MSRSLWRNLEFHRVGAFVAVRRAWKRLILMPETVRLSASSHSSFLILAKLFIVNLPLSSQLASRSAGRRDRQDRALEILHCIPGLGRELSRRRAKRSEPGRLLVSPPQHRRGQRSSLFANAINHWHGNPPAAAGRPLV